MEVCPSGLWCNLGKVVGVKATEVRILLLPRNPFIERQYSEEALVPMICPFWESGL